MGPAEAGKRSIHPQIAVTSMSEESERPDLCPSAPATVGAMLIGVVTAEGRVANVGTPLTIDSMFIETARVHGPLEERFRFSSPCARAECTNWTGRECGLIGNLYDAAAQARTALASHPLPRCAIRPSCRWWQQRGRSLYCRARNQFQHSRDRRAIECRL